MKFYRQGDVGIIYEPGEIPQGATVIPRDRNRIVLAYGEVTGHAHAITDASADLVRTDTDERFLRIMSAVTLQHEEHGAVTLPVPAPGERVRVIAQREYVAPEIVRRVAD